MRRNYEGRILILTAIFVFILVGIVATVMLQKIGVDYTYKDEDSLAFIVINASKASFTIILVVIVVEYVNRERSKLLNRIIDDVGSTQTSGLFEEYEMLRQTYLGIKKTFFYWHDRNFRQQNEIRELKSQLQAEESRLEILKQKLIQNELDRENFRHNVFESLSAIESIVIMCDYDGVVQYANKHAKEQFFISEGLSIFDALLMDESEFHLYRNRNYTEVKFYSRMDSSVSFNGRVKRYTENENSTFILFVIDILTDSGQLENIINALDKDIYTINEVSTLLGNADANIDSLGAALQEVTHLERINHITIRILKPDGSLVMFANSDSDSPFITRAKLTLDNSHMGLALKENRRIFITSKESMEFEEPEIDEILAKGGYLSYIPLYLDNKPVAVLTTLTYTPAEESLKQLLESLRINILIALEKLLHYDKLKRNYFLTVESFVRAYEYKVNTGKGHSRRVSQICVIIAGKLYFNPSEIDDLMIAALLHDIGKITLSSQDENTKHGRVGSEILKKAGFKSDVLGAIRNFSDWYQEKQPLYAQIISIANDFDKVYNQRPEYFTALNFIDYSKTLAGTKYSPQIVSIFERMIITQNKALFDLYGGEDV